MKEKVSLEETRKVAKLAKLEFSDEELARYAENMNRILEYMDKLGELDTEGIEATIHAVELETPFREDEPHVSLPREEGLKNAPDTREGFNKVPRIMEEH